MIGGLASPADAPGPSNATGPTDAASPANATGPTDAASPANPAGIQSRTSRCAKGGEQDYKKHYHRNHNQLVHYEPPQNFFKPNASSA
jgi:hypothetical protein